MCGECGGGSRYQAAGSAPVVIARPIGYTTSPRPSRSTVIRAAFQKVENGVPSSGRLYFNNGVGVAQTKVANFPTQTRLFLLRKSE